MMDTQRNNDVLPTVIPVLRDRWFEPFRAPWRRRTLSVIWGGLIIAMMVLIAAGSGAAGVGAFAFLVGIVLNLTMRNMADAPHDKLDERMVAARDHAFRLSYYAVGVVIVVAIAAVLLLNKDPIALDRQQLLEAAWCTALVVMFLPPAILAWTEEVV